MKTKLPFSLLCLLFLIGCKTKIDYSNPKEVLFKYQTYIIEDKLNKAYELISDTSKMMLTFQDFLDFNMALDSSNNFKPTNIEEIIQLPIDTQFPDYRSFEIKEISTNVKTRDSRIGYLYLNTRNQGNVGWRVLFESHLEKSASELEGKSRYDEALIVCDKILKNDPLNGEAYLIKAWINFRIDNNILLEQYGRKALNLQPKNPQSHVIMAAILDTKGLYESAKLSNQRALKYAIDPEEISQILSNTSVIFENLNQLDSSIIYLKKANSSSIKTHALWRLASIYEKLNIVDSSQTYFERAITNKPMDNYLQIQLYCNYADFLFNKARTKQTGTTEQISMIQKAKTVILRALDLDPNDTGAKRIFENINKNAS